MTASPTRRLERRWLWIALGASLAGAAFTLLLASQATLIWEEAHYRLAGRHPDWGYPDSPLGAPLLNALSEALFGTSLLGSRLLTWLISALTPLAVWWLARQLSGRIEALQAAAIAAILPPLLMAGAHAYPEGPLQFLGVLFLAALIRARRRDSYAAWALAGAVCAVGVAYYYRFWFLPAGVLVFLLVDAQGRQLWTNRKAWPGGAIAMTGLAPSLIHNLREDWAPVLFQLSGRQDWAFWPQALAYPIQQAGLVSPLFFLFMIAGVVVAARAWRGGDSDRGLVLCGAAMLVAPYLALAFFDKDYLLHWPFMAYAPLCVFIPSGLSALARRAPGLTPRLWARTGAGAASALALISAGAAGWTFLAWRHPGALVARADQGGMTGGDLEDWSVLEPVLAEALEAAGPYAVLAVGDHITAVQLQIAARAAAPVYVLDHPEDVSRNYQGYRALQGEAEADLYAERAGAAALIALKEPSYLYRDAERVAMRERLCGRFQDITRLGTHALTPGRVRLSLFTARVREAAGDPDPGRCALFPSAVIEQPEAGSVRRRSEGEIPVYGAAAHRDGIASIIVRLDGRPVARADDLFELPGQFPDTLDFDPGWPAVYWDVRVDLSGVRPGRRLLSIEAITGAGESFLAEARVIYVR